MAVLTGDVVSMNSLETTVHPVGAIVFVRLHDQTVGSAEVDDNNQFRVELPDDLAGEVEVHLGMLNAAPTLFDYTGQDVHIQLFHSNVNNFIA